tara:strand:- start:14946 stop:15911 length:966 start_codon:yes stop_codon:yes gene_type:complete
MSKSKPKNSKKKISRGQQQYMLAKDIKEQGASLESQQSDETTKAEKRSLWSTVGGILGAAAGVAAAPAVLGFLGAGALTGAAATIATGLGTAATTAIGTGIGAGGGLKAAKETGAKRKDIKVDKFYNKQAEEATETFKDYDRNINKQIKGQMAVSGVMAGLQAAGAFKKAGDLVKKGLNMGDSVGQTTSSVVGKGADIAQESPLTIGTDAGSTRLNLDTGQWTSSSPKDAGILQQGSAGYSTDTLSFVDIPDLSQLSKDSTSVFGPTSNKSLYSTLASSVGSGLTQSAIGAGVNYAMGRNNNQEQRNQPGSFDMPDIYDTV